MMPVEIHEKIKRGLADITAGRVVSQDDIDTRMKKQFMQK